MLVKNILFSNMAISSTIPRGPVTVKLNYFNPPADGTKPYNHVDIPPQGLPQRNFDDVAVETQIHDIRGSESEYTLNKDAFKVILDAPDSAEIDFFDDESIKAKYYPEVAKLLLENIPGTSEIFIFDYTIRRAVPNAKRGPVNRAHIDQTAEAAAMRV